MQQFRQVANLFAELGLAIGNPANVDEALAAITSAAVQTIERADAASITQGRHRHFQTVCATSDLPLRVDSIQYELVSGPCVDAALADKNFHSDDLRCDARWPEFGRRAAEETGVLSMLSYRLFFEDDDQVAALNIYATKPYAFDDSDETTGLVLATQASFAISGAAQDEKIEHLERALSSNRDIGVAMGIVMNRYLVSRDEAFNILRMVSQHSHRKLVEVALEVVDTGELVIPPLRPSGSA